MPLFRLCVLVILVSVAARADTHSRFLYLANEGVAVFHDDTTLLFDPLFRNGYGHYSLVPEPTRNAMFIGSAPFTAITAVFVSHHHGDHFDPADMLRLLTNNESTQMYAPQQVIDAMKHVAGNVDALVFERTTAVDLSYADDPLIFQNGNIVVEAFFVPHSGWPTKRTDVQNIAFRVTVDDQALVVHLGDADPNLIHFDRHEEQWRKKNVDVALPPYWFFNSKDGNGILQNVIQPGRSIGVHVPASFAHSDNIPDDLQGFDLFIEPGETRQ